MKKIFSLTFLTLILSACGGGSDNNSSTSNNNSNSNPTAPSPSNNNQALSKLQINNPSVGQMLVFGNGTLTPDFSSQVANKKYYARYAYCYDTLCSDIRIGQMNFTLSKVGTELKVGNLNVDKLGKITMDNQDVPHYTALATGPVSLANSNLTLRDAKTNHYNLKLTTASTVEDKLGKVDIEIYFSNDGMHIAGADDDYLFVAQQLNAEPNDWKNDVSKSAVLGNWKAYETDDNLKVLTKSNITVQINDILQGASPMYVSGTKGNYNGYYKNLGSGYVLGYTENNQPLQINGNNYNGIDGLIINSPDNQFGIGYDARDKQSFLLFR